MFKILILSLWVFAQPVHVSFMGVECFPEKGTIKVNLKMSHDDFVYDYRFIVDDDKNFDPSGKIDTTEIFVRQYLNNRIQISANDKKLKLQLAKIDPLPGEVNLELLFYYNRRARHFRLQNSILTGLNKNPSNLVIFKNNEFEEGIRFTEDLKEHTFTLK